MLSTVSKLSQRAHDLQQRARLIKIVLALGPFITNADEADDIAIERGS